MKTKHFKQPSLILALSTLCLSACSNFGQELSENSEFLTRMSDSGLKHFELRYLPPEAKEKSKKQQQEQASRPTSPKRRYKKVLSQMTDEAERQIEENHYCREGFWIMSLVRKGPSLRMRGECNELASKEDRDTYPDSIKHW